MSEKYDLAIIGAGPGGYVAAIRAAQLGMKVVCIDKRNTLGGTCLNVGCIPSKALLQSTELLYHLEQDGQTLGLQLNKLGYDFTTMMRRKEHVVHSLVQGVAGLFKGNHVTYLHGEASFIDPHRLQITNSSEKSEVEAETILIATGSESIALPNLPFNDKTIISSTEALSLNQVPKTMAVIGGGVIGVELASVYRRLGTEITIIEMLPHICPMLDIDLSKQLFQALKKQGIKFMLSTQVLKGAVKNDQVKLTVKHQEGEQDLTVDLVLVAVGRRPFTSQLGLENAGVTVDKRGFIPVDGQFRTSQPNIYAIGDVIEGTMLAHRASEEGTLVVESLKGMGRPIDYMSIPNVIYTYPEVATIGLTEAEGLLAGLKMDIGTAYFKGNPRARCSGETDGLVKVIGDQNTGCLVGMHIIGPHASELIGEGVVAIQQRMTLEDLAYTVHAHPTLSEAIKEAVLCALGRPLHG